MSRRIPRRETPACSDTDIPSAIEPRAALAANLRFYRDHAGEFVRRTSALDMGELHDRFLRRLPRQGRILDAGCGSGRDSVLFLRRGFRVTAVDASPAMVAVARRAGVRARVLPIQAISYRRAFDGIWACASLLHVPRAEISDVLRRLNRALRPNGVLLVTLKEGKGERIEGEGRFFAYYGLDEFKALLRSTGDWSRIESRRSRDGKSRAWLNFLARRSGPT